MSEFRQAPPETNRKTGSPFLPLRVFSLEKPRGWKQRMDVRATLVARCNFSRQHAELIAVPIANEHRDRGQHLLIAGVSLGVASSLLRPQMFEFKHDSWRISIVSHDPSPTMRIANFLAKHGDEGASWPLG
jgi:hypothetical protein